MNYTWASGGLNFIRSAHPDKVENLVALDRWVKVVGGRPGEQIVNGRWQDETIVASLNGKSPLSLARSMNNAKS